MRRSQRRLGFLLAGVAVLVALVVWQWHQQRANATLLTLDPATITRIDVSRRGQPTRHYRKRDGHWFQGDQRVDDARLESLAALAATPVLQWRQASSMDPAKIGLAAPAVTLRLDGHTLAYGALASFGPQRFVRVGQRIAVVPASYSPRSPTSSPSSQKS